MTFSVKEIFLTLQGEGHNAGRLAVFVRFAGCNMWSGREQDRSNGRADCSRWCDTDFVGGEKLSNGALLERIAHAWGGRPARPFVVFTGGEPALQLTADLLRHVAGRDIDVAVETNGSLPLPAGQYWRTVSPKRTDIVVQEGDELKLIYPTIAPEAFEQLAFKHFYLQPLDNACRERNTAAAVEYIRDHPQWRLSLQTHKIIGIP